MEKRITRQRELEGNRGKRLKGGGNAKLVLGGLFLLETPPFYQERVESSYATKDLVGKKTKLYEQKKLNNAMRHTGDLGLPLR